MSLGQLVRKINHARINKMRRFSLSAVSFLFDSRSRFMKDDSTSNPILILRLDDKIGDSITATGFLRELKQIYPGRRLIVLSGSATSFVYKNLPAVDEVVVAKKGLFSTWALFLRLNKRKYTLIVNTSHLLSPRVIFLVSQLMAARKLSFRSFSSRIFSQYVDYDPLFDHISLRYQKTLKAIGIEREDLSYEFPLSTEDLVVARELLTKENPQKLKLVVLNSFAGARMRSLNAENTLKIVQGLLQDPAVLVVSVGNQNDLSLASQWQKRAGFERWKVFPELTDFHLNAALISFSDVLITPDTALVHLASALKIPVVAIYRADAGGEKERNTQIWAPYGTRYKMILAFNDGSEDPDINAVKPEEILGAAQDLLGEKSN